jgi:hypothetical protein
MASVVVLKSQQVTKSVIATPAMTAPQWETSLMTKFVALLRAVNVGGTSKLSMERHGRRNPAAAGLRNEVKQSRQLQLILAHAALVTAFLHA